MGYKVFIHDPITFPILWHIYQKDNLRDFSKVSYCCVLMLALGWPLFIWISSDWTITLYVFPALIMTWFYTFFFGYGLFSRNKMCFYYRLDVFHLSDFHRYSDRHLFINIIFASSVIFCLMMLLSFQREYAARQLFRERQKRFQSLNKQTVFAAPTSTTNCWEFSSTELLAPYVHENAKSI